MIKIYSVTLTPGSTTVGANVAIKVAAQEVTWGTIKNDFADWNTIKTALINWAAVNNYR